MHHPGFGMPPLHCHASSPPPAHSPIHPPKCAPQLGFETGSGFVIRRLGEGRWSAPLFVSATAMRAGAIAGVEKVATVALSLTRDLADHLQEGRSPQLGADISLRLGTAVEAVSAWEGGIQALHSTIGVGWCWDVP